ASNSGPRESPAVRGGEELPRWGPWETALRLEWAEDDDLFDEDLPVEPLEAPDDGPDVFEGEVIAPGPDLSRPLRVLLLVGLPGSGKSSLSARLSRFGWTVVNQDILG
ncbi:unnamed protein product, partial [Polarella glacialis]